LALYVALEGFAALRQLQNSVQMIDTVASGTINKGLIKYTAKLHKDEARQSEVWQIAGTVTLSKSVLFSMLVVIFRVILRKKY
jgi:polysaccharide transporter, PST family